MRASLDLHFRPWGIVSNEFAQLVMQGSLSGQCRNMGTMPTKLRPISAKAGPILDQADRTRPHAGRFRRALAGFGQVERLRPNFDQHCSDVANFAKLNPTYLGRYLPNLDRYLQNSGRRRSNSGRLRPNLVEPAVDDPPYSTSYTQIRLNKTPGRTPKLAPHLGNLRPNSTTFDQLRVHFDRHRL